MFSYGKMLRIDYEDADFVALLVVIEKSKGTRELFLSENNLVVSGCHPVELRHIL